MTGPEGVGDLIVRIGGGPPGTGRDRTAAKRAAIVDAATGLFLAHGFQATSTEQIAAAAAVSKQTVYNQFGDKQRLFADIVLGVTATAERFAAELPRAVEGVHAAGELEPALCRLARSYLTTVLSPRVVALRRLVIGEANRVPELAAEYYRRAPGRSLAAIAELMTELASRDLLDVPDADEAAAHFAYLVLGRSQDEEMFRAGTGELSSDEIARRADRAVRVFLAAYRAGARSDVSRSTPPV